MRITPISLLVSLIIPALNAAPLDLTLDNAPARCGPIARSLNTSIQCEDVVPGMNVSLQDSTHVDIFYNLTNGIAQLYLHERLGAVRYDHTVIAFAYAAVIDGKIRAVNLIHVGVFNNGYLVHALGSSSSWRYERTKVSDPPLPPKSGGSWDVTGLQEFDWLRMQAPKHDFQTAYTIAAKHADEQDSERLQPKFGVGRWKQPPTNNPDDLFYMFFRYPSNQVLLVGVDNGKVYPYTPAPPS